MAHKTGNRYPREFKQQIIDLYHTDTPVAKTASEYGIIEQTIYKSQIKNLPLGTELPKTCYRY